MKKNTSKKNYKIPFLYHNKKCQIEILYQKNHSYFHINVSSNHALNENDLKTIEIYMESEGFFEDAKNYYLDNKNYNNFLKK
jgi:hypothetical protein